MIIPFSQILKQYMTADKGSPARHLSEMTKRLGIEVSRRNIHRYENSLVVPSFRFAKALVLALGLEMTDSEIEESIMLEREKQSELKVVRKQIKKTVTINFEDSTRWDPESLYRMSEEIASNKYPSDPKSYEKYILGLITKDVERKTKYGK